ncbi:probable inactive leucine-rich repeat receptor kinase XIAO [Rhodamnia argentea]|uniref:Probable inactive leucine-rich repeat receptor kinase XIAO n=1 Tax=Rhodamnia argentea TaxID=178133 RepID=A0A8B8NXN7_9MYRT|nr:probable inactive leucine-rich repeat receptor kinase XIAO [Rhodamnia argentea]
MPPLSSSLSLTLFVLAIAPFSRLFLPADSRTHPGDIRVLKALKASIDPKSVSPGSCVGSWDFSVDPCDRAFSDRFTCGLRCDVAVSNASRVTEIALDSAGYSGSLSSVPWDDGVLYLQTLDVSYNSFAGSVPGSLSRLTSLRRLRLSRNSLSGQLPASLGSLAALEELSLDGNNFHGGIPSSFNRLAGLKRLELQGNNLSGELLSNLGSLQSLNFLDASDNNFSGVVPASLPPSLVELSLRNNRLRGDLPEIISVRAKLLQVLDLSRNELSGAVPSALFEHPSLEQLTLSHNNFTSLHAPPAGGANSRLVAVDLSYNNLRGLLPGFMAVRPRLSALSLEHNMFTGMIPVPYALRVRDAAAVEGRGGTAIRRLLLGGNYLFGPIPGPLMGLRPGSANVSLVDNCLYRCPDEFFFCRGGDQKSPVDCKSFSPAIP